MPCMENVKPDHAVWMLYSPPGLLPAARKFGVMLLSEQKLDGCFFLRSFFLGGLDHTAMQDKCLLPSFLLRNCSLALGRCGWGKAEVNGFPALHFVGHVYVRQAPDCYGKRSINALYSLYPPEQRYILNPYSLLF